MRCIVNTGRIKSITAVIICVLLVIFMGTMTAMAEDSSVDHGRDAHSPSMSVGPDGTSEGALETPEGYEDRNITEEEIEAVSGDETASSEEDNSSNEEQEKEERSLDSRILAAMIAAGVTIVVCEYITKKIKK